MTYLYNSVELPPLPDWDRQSRPYAMIRPYGKSYELFVTDSRWVYNGNRCVLSSGDYTNTICYQKRSASTEWAYAYEGNALIVADHPIWTNHDILYKNSTEVYIPASYPIDPETREEIRIYDPIPVGSAPDIEPRSFMAGLRMGQFIRGMRV